MLWTCPFHRGSSFWVEAFLVDFIDRHHREFCCVSLCTRRGSFQPLRTNLAPGRFGRVPLERTQARPRHAAECEPAGRATVTVALRGAGLARGFLVLAGATVALR